MINSDIMQISSLSARTDDYLMRVNKLNTDSGWILESKEDTASYEKDSQVSLVIGKNSDFYWNGRVNISNMVDIYTRKYVKLQGILASAGGFIKFVMTIFCFINNYINDSSFYSYLLNDSIVNFNTIYTRRDTFPKSKSPAHSFSSSSVSHKKSARTINSHAKNLLTTNSAKINFIPRRIKPLHCLEKFFYSCTYGKKSVLKRFELFYKELIDIKNLFLHINKVNLMEKLLFSNEKETLEKLAIHKNIIEELNNRKGVAKLNTLKRANYIHAISSV